MKPQGQNYHWQWTVEKAGYRDGDGVFGWWLNTGSNRIWIEHEKTALMLKDDFHQTISRLREKVTELERQNELLTDGILLEKEAAVSATDPQGRKTSSLFDPSQECPFCYLWHNPEKSSCHEHDGTKLILIRQRGPILEGEISVPSGGNQGAPPVNPKETPNEGSSAMEESK